MTIEATYDGPPPLNAVCHCLLVWTEQDGLVLIETGLGTDDMHRPQDLSRPGVDRADAARTAARQGAALRQIEQLGHSASDVRHIALTHLDVDHSGGLPDFPWARVHVMAAELAGGRGRGAQPPLPPGALGARAPLGDVRAPRRRRAAPRDRGR